MSPPRRHADRHPPVAGLLAVAVALSAAAPTPMPDDRQVTTADHGHVLTNANCWSPDGRWLVYDCRSSDGSTFDGDRIERVQVDTGRVEVLYTASPGVHVGVPTCSPSDGRVVFIIGPADPTPDWPYGPAHRRGIIVAPARPGPPVPLDGRNLVPPFTPGALRGGSHVHVFSPDGRWVSFTYDDAVVPGMGRNVAACCLPAGPVHVPPGLHHHDGTGFTVLASQTVADPRPGSDQISRAYEDAWVGTDGYVRGDGTRQHRAIAFQGDCRAADGRTVTEVYITDLPDDPTHAGPAGPLAGTRTALPSSPAGTAQRRLTFTADRPHPGISGPRHWLRSSPDGTRIAFLMPDDAGVIQVWTVPPTGGPPTQLSRDPWPVASAFTWDAAGDALAYVADGSVMRLDARTGHARRLTPQSDVGGAPLPLACVFSPDGTRIAYLRRPTTSGHRQNQLYVVRADR